MINVIIGEKGTGKTARLIDAVHEAEAASNGSVVFINKGQRHLFDLSHKVRLVDTEGYSIESYDDFYGFICGMLSQNYDIANIFIDSITKIVNDDMNDFAKFLDRISVVADEANVNIQLILSMNPSNAPEGVLKYTK